MHYVIYNKGFLPRSVKDETHLALADFQEQKPYFCNIRGLVLLMVLSLFWN